MSFYKVYSHCIFLFFPCLVLAQEVQKDSIELQLLDFLISTDDAGSIHENLFFYDMFNNISSQSITYLPENSISLFSFHTLKLPRYDHYLILYNNHYFIINMRRPLQTIIEELYRHFIKAAEFSEELQYDLIQIIRQGHRNNWERNHIEEEFYIDEQGKFQPILYDPEKW